MKGQLSKCVSATLPMREARSGDADLLASPQSFLDAARIHSIFERAINLESGQGLLLTLACADADNAPDTLVVDVPRWSGLTLAPGETVQYVHGTVVLGNFLAISLAQATPWQCRLPAYPKKDSQLRTNLALAREILSQQGTGIGVGRVNPDNDIDRVLRGVFAQACDGLCAALATGDLSQARAHATQLIGLGPGLTPVGDDFLLGLLVALNLPQSPAFALRVIGDFVLACAAGRTHAISLAGLRHAAAGRVRERVVALCESLLLGDPTSIRTALERVLQIGSSSGTDIALGLLSGFRLHLQH